MQRYDDGAGRGRINISSAFAPLLRNLNIREASDPTALILDNVPIGQKARTERGKPPDRVVAEEGAVETDCHYGHWPFTEFTNRKVRMSRNTEENVHIVGLPSLFVTRHSRISSQIAKIRADFLHKTGLSCINLSKVLTFSGSPAGKSLRKTRNFQGLEIFFRGPDGKVPAQKLFCSGAEAVFSSSWSVLPCGSRVSLCRRNPRPGFPAIGASAPGVPRAPSERQRNGLSPRHFDSRKPCVAALFPRRPGLGSEYASLRERK